MQGKKKVFVALSGGVDSSTSAALLQREGYDVTGVFIKVWSPDFLPCTWREERRDAMRVCAHLSIPFLTFDFEDEYKQSVVDYMIEEYRKGNTPNPDVMCNKYIKFGRFLKESLARGADCIATGHYARNMYEGGLYHLLAGEDTNKDQSYFLWTLTQYELSRTLFPVGALTKPQVRMLAKEFGLPTALKRESQGLCFLGKVDMSEFLSHYLPAHKGIVLDENGKEIGWHPGAVYFTLGKRHGFTVTHKSPSDSPYYVIGIEVHNNTITVSHTPSDAKTRYNKRDISIIDTNWIAERPMTGTPLLGRLRYRQTLSTCVITDIEDSAAVVSFADDQPIVPKGQSLVLYDGERCVGGGIIT